MQYISTRGGAPVSAAEAIVRVICPSGGLYVPAEFPQISIDTLLPYANDYHTAAEKIMQLYLDIPEEKLHEYIHSAYGAQFDVPEIAPVVPLSGSESVLELWHGPTLAFKDMALQMLPYLMRDSLCATGEDKQIYILVATSGDTGRPRSRAFATYPARRCRCLYPHGGVSRAQWLQMVTQEGSNVHVCGVKGNFDDAQTAVKRIFGDASLRAQAEEKGYKFSSANSINFGRCCRRSHITSRPTCTCAKAARSHAAKKSISACPPAISAIYSRVITPCGWVFRQEAHLRLQPQQCADGFLPQGRIRQPQALL